jgi:NADPH-dependent ferric siderophore reductase
MLELPVPDPRRDPTDPPPAAADDYRELAIALGAANLAMPAIAERLERIERMLDVERVLEELEERAQRQTAPALPTMRERGISQHEAEQLVATATKSERVRAVVQRTALEAGGRVLLWALAIVGSLVIAGVVGFTLRDCATRGAPVTPLTHP